jgi:hypothetical protein
VTGLVVGGILSLLAPIMTSFEGMAVFAALYGFFGGSFFALISVMLAEALGECAVMFYVLKRSVLKRTIFRLH